MSRTLPLRAQSSTSIPFRQEGSSPISSVDTPSSASATLPSKKNRSERGTQPERTANLLSHTRRAESSHADAIELPKKASNSRSTTPPITVSESHLKARADTPTDSVKEAVAAAAANSFPIVQPPDPSNSALVPPVASSAPATSPSTEVNDFASATQLPKPRNADSAPPAARVPNSASASTLKKPTDPALSAIPQGASVSIVDSPLPTAKSYGHRPQAEVTEMSDIAIGASGVTPAIVDCTKFVCAKGTSVTLIVGALALAILVCGFALLVMVWRGKFSIRDPRNDPLSPHLLQIMGVSFLLPVILVIGSTGLLASEAMTALLGAIVGYLFGTSHNTVQTVVPRDNREPPAVTNAFPSNSVPPAPSSTAAAPGNTSPHPDVSGAASTKPDDSFKL